MAPTDSTPIALFVHNYDAVSGQTRMDKFVSLGDIEIANQSLAMVRKRLMSEGVLSFGQMGSAFCNEHGAEVKDSTPFQVYQRSLGISAEKKDNDPTPDPATSRTFKCYFRSRRLPTELDDDTKGFLKEKLDLDPKNPGQVDTNPDGLQSSFNFKHHRAKMGTAAVTHPADMTERDWRVVEQTNCLLHGSDLSDTSNELLTRSMFPAFELQKRQFKDHKPPALDVEPATMQLKIPRYRVQDDSYVEVHENKESVAKAVTRGSLSESSAQFALGVGAYGVGLGANAGRRRSEDTARADKIKKEASYMTVTYNFPRVVLALDESSLGLTDECAKDLTGVKNKASLDVFRQKYGRFFATRVELGGRLHSSESSNALGTASASQKAKAMKEAAGLSFSSPYAKASLKYDNTDSTNSGDEVKESNLTISISWEAKGGDTLLCNNPAAWCSTVASFYNWRVVKQDKLVDLDELISRIPGYQHVAETFDAIEREENKLLTGTEMQVAFHQRELAKWVTIDAKSDWAAALLENALQWKQELSPEQKKYFNDVCKPKLTGAGGFTMGEATNPTKQQQLQVCLVGTGASKNQLINGAFYRFYCPSAEKWVGATDLCPGYFHLSILYLSDEENSANFQVISQTQALGQADPIEEGEEVIIIAFSQQKSRLGQVGFRKFNNAMVLVADDEAEQNKKTELLKLTARYLASPQPGGQG